MRHITYNSLGMCTLSLGVLGAFLPVMPSTCFFILSAFFFSKGSPRLEAWVLNHPQFGPSVRDWNERRAISRPAKKLAAIGMTIGWLIAVLLPSTLLLKIAASVIIFASAAYVFTRPS